MIVCLQTQLTTIEEWICALEAKLDERDAEIVVRDI